MPQEHSHDKSNLSDSRLLSAIALNLLLTVVESVGGVVSGSLSLVADALHNFNDCASLVIALIARRISRKPADKRRTFGYRRAEVIGALINLTVLIVVGLYLIYEAVERFINPREIEGWTVLVIAGVALIVDVATASMLFAMSRGSLNVRAAFLHNVSDALGSLGVILVGIAILLWKFYLLDAFVALLIAGYILWQSIAIIRQSIHILMESVPDDIDLDALVTRVQSIDGVLDIHHVHIWHLDEDHRALEAHIVINEADSGRMELLKCEIKKQLNDRFEIGHSTLEFEFQGHQDGHSTDLVPDH